MTRNLYGMTEAGLQLMRSCHEGSVHLNEELFFIEFTEWKGFQRLLFTTLDNELSPLIRYESTDLFEYSEDDSLCSCGSPLRRIKNFNGRIRDVLYHGDRALPLGMVDRAIGVIDGMLMYQLEKSGDNLHVLFVGSACPESLQKTISDRLFPLFGTDLKVTAQSRSRLPLDRVGKFQFLTVTDHKHSLKG